jgi:hypothetical protein
MQYRRENNEKSFAGEVEKLLFLYIDGDFDSGL